MNVEYICAECGGFEEDDNGLCVHGHDNWMELNGEPGITDGQRETFETNLKLPLNIVYLALNGNVDAIEKIKRAHKKWEKENIK